MPISDEKHNDHHEWLGNNASALDSIIESVNERKRIRKDIEGKLIWAAIFSAVSLITTLIGLGIVAWVKGLAIS